MPKINVDEFKEALGASAVSPKLYIIGECHEDSALQRDLEFEFCKEHYGASSMVMENQFPSGLYNMYNNPIMADPLDLRVRMYTSLAISEIVLVLEKYQASSTFDSDCSFFMKELSSKLNDAAQELENSLIKVQLTNQNISQFDRDALYCQVESAEMYESLVPSLKGLAASASTLHKLMIDDPVSESILDFICELGDGIHEVDQVLAGYEYEITDASKEFDLLDGKREVKMLEGACRFQLEDSSIVWKIGNDHVKNMLDEKCPYKELVEKSKCVLVTKQEFNEKLKLYQEEQNKQSKIKAAKTSSSFGLSTSQMQRL